MGNSQTTNGQTAACNVSRRSSNVSRRSSNVPIPLPDTSVPSYRSRNQACNPRAKLDTTLVQSPNTSVHFPKTSTNLPKTSTNLSNTSTNLTKTSTNLSKTSMNLTKTSVQLSNTSVNMSSASVQFPKTSTNLPKTTTNLSKTSTNLTKTSVQLPNTSANLSSTSVQFPKTSTNLPKTSTNLSKTSLQLPNTSVQSSNFSILSSIKPPRQIMSEEEFFQKWSDWKDDFLTFKKISNEEKPDDGKWGNKLLNTMGPIGQTIYNTFIFSSLNDKINLDVLLNKFDEYSVFKSVNKLPGDDVYVYIHQLQLRANEANIKNAEELVKNKILKEIDERTFTNVAKGLLRSFKFSSDFNNLTLKEIAFIWKTYDGNFKEGCYRCGNNHNCDHCPAMGAQCSRCNEWNHSAKRCPTIYITNCNYCGDSHFKKRCPAYNETCTKCKKLNHFSWKCQSRTKQIVRCLFCGGSHAASKSLCPARNTICTRCKKIGHFVSECRMTYSNNS